MNFPKELNKLILSYLPSVINLIPVLDLINLVENKINIGTNTLSCNVIRRCILDNLFKCFCELTKTNELFIQGSSVRSLIDTITPRNVVICIKMSIPQIITCLKNKKIFEKYCLDDFKYVHHNQFCIKASVTLKYINIKIPINIISLKYSHASHNNFFIFDNLCINFNNNSVFKLNCQYNLSDIMFCICEKIAQFNHNYSIENINEKIFNNILIEHKNGYKFFNNQLGIILICILKFCRFNQKHIYTLTTCPIQKILTTIILILETNEKNIKNELRILLFPNKKYQEIYNYYSDETYIENKFIDNKLMEIICNYKLANGT